MLILLKIPHADFEINREHLHWNQTGILASMFAPQNKNMKFDSGEKFITHCEWIYILNLSALSMFDLW